MKKHDISNSVRSFFTAITLAAAVVAGSAIAAPKNFTNTVTTHDSATGSSSKYTGRTLSNGQREEQVVVAKGAQNMGGCCLDPRVERHYTHKIPSNTNSDYQWKGFVIVDKAHDTTVFQLLNTDDSDSDKHRPTLFLEANRFTNSSGDKILRICDGRCNEGGNQIRWQRNDNNFHLRVKVIDGKTAQVYIDNVLRLTKTLDRYTNRSGAQIGDRTAVRYGAYHHDTKVVGPSNNRVKEAKSEAKVRIRDPEFKRL